MLANFNFDLFEFSAAILEKGLLFKALSIPDVRGQLKGFLTTRFSLRFKNPGHAITF